MERPPIDPSTIFRAVRPAPSDPGVPGDPRRAAAWMVQGTASGVGKSLIVTGLCRLLRRRGLRVTPFKPWTRSVAAPTDDGRAVGCAVARQAEAAGMAASVDMNPILVERVDGGVRLALEGRVVARDELRGLDANRLHAIVARALERLRAKSDIVLIEGSGGAADAGSGPFGDASVSLPQPFCVPSDMRVAADADASVWLLADAERGGAIAALLGTYELFEPADRDRVGGFLVNRSHPSDDDAAHVAYLERRTGRPFLGRVAELSGLRLDGGDGPADPPTAATPRSLGARQRIYERIADALAHGLDPALWDPDCAEPADAGDPRSLRAL